jgi:hypothetical protein
MDEQTRSLQELYHIKKMMERSSRFTGLSSLSGISAGICGLSGAWIGFKKINCWQHGDCSFGRLDKDNIAGLQEYLLVVAIITFSAAVITSFIFTLLRSKKSGTSLCATITLRLLWNITIPLLACGFFLIRIIQLGQYELIAPCCLIFYGLALVNASKYTLSEVRFLGYGQILLGMTNLWLPGYGIFFWAAGFGILHIMYGIVIWFRYEGNQASTRRTSIAA